MPPPLGEVGRRKLVQRGNAVGMYPSVTACTVTAPLKGEPLRRLQGKPPYRGR